MRDRDAAVSWEEIFEETGIQFMPLNTLYQLAAETPDRLAEVAQILWIGDAFNHHLSGVAVAEVTLASTSMLYNPRAHGWSGQLLDRLGLEGWVFPRIVASGTRLGPLRREICEATGLANTEVVASCSHDTAAAVVGVPAEGDDWAYLSSGTWSLMGVEIPEPVITPAARRLNFTNEIGFGNTVRLLKNISGLWLLQECRREWTEAGEDLEYGRLVAMASESPPFASLVMPTDPRFLAPGGMSERIRAFCREHGERVPENPAAVVRCIFESLALLYRRTREQLEAITGRPIRRLHVVGGGSRNELLNQFTADALQVPVFAGPVESTAVGNLLVQAYALGRLGSLEDIRRVVRRSFHVRRYEPRSAAEWDAAYERFQKLG